MIQTNCYNCKSELEVDGTHIFCYYCKSVAISNPLSDESLYFTEYYFYKSKIVWIPLSDQREALFFQDNSVSYLTPKNTFILQGKFTIPNNIEECEKIKSRLLSLKAFI